MSSEAGDSQLSDSRSPSQLGVEQERLFSAFEQNLKKTLMSFQGLGAKRSGDSDDAVEDDSADQADDHPGRGQRLLQHELNQGEDDEDDQSEELPEPLPTRLTSEKLGLAGAAPQREDLFRAKEGSAPSNGRTVPHPVNPKGKPRQHDSQSEESEEEKELMSKYHKLVGKPTALGSKLTNQNPVWKEELKIEFGKKTNVFQQKQRREGDSLDDDEDDNLDESDDKLDSENMRRINQRLERLKDMPDNSDGDEEDSASHNHMNTEPYKNLSRPSQGEAPLHKTVVEPPR